MSSHVSLPQELVNQIIDNLSENRDLKACSLVSTSWSFPARNRLFHYVYVRPGEVEDWLSRPPESVQRMAPHIVKFGLSERWVQSQRTLPFYWDDSEGLLTRVISSIALSPVRWLRIESFGTGGFNKTTLERCFEPVCHSIRSLELNNLAACPDATIYLVSLFHDLDNLHIGDILPKSTQPAPEWDGCGTKHSPKLSGTLRFYNAENTDDSKLFANIISLSPRFREISPGKLTGLDWNAVRRLLEVCAETLESVLLVWWPYGDRLPPNLFTSCQKLRKVGFGIWEEFRGTEVQKTLSSITSEHLSTVSFELAHPDWYMTCHTWEQFHEWWGGLESALCHLADRLLADGGSPLVLEIIWWRPDGHEGVCGTVPHPDTIMPRFREKGLIRFAESDLSDCDRCAEIFEEESRANGGV